MQGCELPVGAQQGSAARQRKPFELPQADVSGLGIQRSLNRVVSKQGFAQPQEVLGIPHGVLHRVGIPVGESATCGIMRRSCRSFG